MMSGGVDSSVAAAVLKEQGYEVIGVFMKCWSLDRLESLGVDKSLYGCFWEEDSKDARQVAAKLDISFYVWDFEEEYKQGVVDYMIEEYARGLTPNPDVMCNSLIKFGVFYKRARKLGADFVATGHYARILQRHGQSVLARGKDVMKDQSYFLWRIDRECLDHLLLPVGDFATKAEVRKKAEELDLVTAKKPDSQGLCFIGETPLRELLLQVLGKKEGGIICRREIAQESTAYRNKKLEPFGPNPEYAILGKHQGAHTYTIGQREKLGLAGGPWYVSKINIPQNTVEVVHETKKELIKSQKLLAVNPNWLVAAESYIHSKNLLTATAQIRYRQQPQECEIKIINDQKLEITFLEPVKAVAPGQSIVFYHGEVLLGGAVIESSL